LPLAVRYRSESGTPLISVTQVLTLRGRIEDRWFSEDAAARGSAVHELTEVFDMDTTLAAVACPDDLRGYLDAYASFIKTMRPVYHASEVTVTNALLGLGGRIDRIAEMFGQHGIIDLKTGQPSPWHGMQLAAYNVLRPTGSRWALYLRGNGTYRLKDYDDPIDHRRFMADLAATRGTITTDGDYWT
jgi:hypothetical protein